MTPEQWQQVSDLFCELLGHSSESRPRLLGLRCKDKAIQCEVERLLEEHDHAGDFLAEPAYFEFSRPLAEPINSVSEFQDTPRFAVQQRLGEGAFGVVYRVLDRKRNAVVALKVLRHLDSGHLARFKHEFRSLVDLVHPNLVQLYELFGDEHRWFYTMELVEGEDFLRSMRPNDAIQSWDGLRESLIQLTAGIQALHRAARVHRDLKPSNVLISTTGRVRILDFGLVKELEGVSAEQSIALAGSPAYMAPEQVGRGMITAAVDWYAVGVMLYRVITGELPFEGDWQDVLNSKQRKDPPVARVLNPDVPDDLNEICLGLLERRVQSRGDGNFILERLHSHSMVPTFHSRKSFVGRRRELGLLNHLFKGLEAGVRQIVLVNGESGIGKTALVDEFVRGVQQERPNTVVLKGRCRESESVPYKALDEVADQLVRYLMCLPAASATALLPRHPALLARIFPVFDELEILSSYSHRTVGEADGQQVRHLAFGAVCETLGRIADRHPLILSIDDVQWSDLDSIAFLAELSVPFHAPTLMLILTYRSEDADVSQPLAFLRNLRASISNVGSLTELDVSGLSEEDGRALLSELDTEQKLSKEQLRYVVTESDGSPLFLQELSRVTIQDAALADEGSPTASVSLKEMIRRRSEALSSGAREVIEALSVAAEPLPRGILQRTVSGPDADLSREIQLLIGQNLVKGSPGFETGKIELFHDKLREACLAVLSSSSLRKWHSRLASALETGETPDPQRLVRHYLGAGDTEAAFRSAWAAAQIAEQALAFDRAASFYLQAIETGEGDASARGTLYRKRAQALGHAGRGRESAEGYLKAAEWPAQNLPIEMQRLASEQLMRSGYLDEGSRIYKCLLRGNDVHFPDRPLSCLLRALAIRTYIRMRGIHWRERTETEIPASTLRKLDLLWNGALVLSSANPIFANYLQARHMLECLRTGEPLRLALSVGLGAYYESLGGRREYARGRELLSITESLSLKLNNTYLTALIPLFWTVLDYMCGRIQSGLEHSQKAAANLDQLAVGVAWEKVTSNVMLIWFLGWGGRIRELSQRLPPILDDARSRGDVYAGAFIRCFTTAHLVDLAADRPDEAIEDVAFALSRWRKSQYDFQHFGAAFATVECQLYAGRVDLARARVLSEWKAMSGSLLFRKAQTPRILLFSMRGRTALAAWLQDRMNRKLLREVEHFARKLMNTGAPWAEAISHMLRASVLAGRDKPREAILLLERAEYILREQDLQLLAAAVMRRRGELEGAAGSERIQAADALMRSENIVRPDRMTFMILPGAC